MLGNIFKIDTKMLWWVKNVQNNRISINDVHVILILGYNYCPCDYEKAKNRRLKEIQSEPQNSSFTCIDIIYQEIRNKIFQ